MSKRSVLCFSISVGSWNEKYDWHSLTIPRNSFIKNLLTTKLSTFSHLAAIWQQKHDPQYHCHLSMTNLKNRTPVTFSNNSNIYQFFLIEITNNKFNSHFIRLHLHFGERIKHEISVSRSGIASKRLNMSSYVLEHIMIAHSIYFSKNIFAKFRRGHFYKGVEYR